MYQNTLMKETKEDLNSKIYFEMKIDPLKGDWLQLVIQYLEKIRFSINDEVMLSSLTKDVFKHQIKNKIKHLSFLLFENMKNTHEKDQINEPQ